MINDHTGRMATELPTPSGSSTAQNGNAESTFTVKTGLARMLKGGVIMDVVNAEQVRNCLPWNFLNPNTDSRHAGPDSRGGGSMCSHGIRTCASRYPGPGRSGTHVGPQNDQGDHGNCHYSCHGQGTNWAFC